MPATLPELRSRLQAVMDGAHESWAAVPDVRSPEAQAFILLYRELLKAVWRIDGGEQCTLNLEG